MAFNLQGMFNWAVQWCNRANVAYDQSYRTMQVRPSDGCTCFDCSSFTFFALWLGGGFDFSPYGYSTDINDYTAIPRRENAWIVNTNMYNILEAAGWNRFVFDANTVEPGDLLIVDDDSHDHYHTEICYSVNPLVIMGARNPNIALDDQVAIHTSYEYWQFGFRWGDVPPTPPGPVPPSDRRKMPLMYYLKPYWKYFIT